MPSFYLVPILALSAAGLLIPGSSPGTVQDPPPAETRHPAPDVDRARAAAQVVLVADLLELAEWCTSKKIFVERKEVFEAVLHFDPENEKAKRGLGFVKGKDGAWVATERRVPLKSWDKGAAKQFPARRTQVVERYRKTMLAVLEAHAEKISRAQRDAVLDDLLVADPDDPAVHALRGEVKLEERWVLAETARAVERRGELRGFVRKALETAPEAKRVDPNEKERALGLEWTAAFETPLARALGTGAEGEIRRLPDAMHAARELFRGALSLEGSYPEGFTVYALARQGDSTRFLGNHPAVDASYRMFLEQLDGSLIQGSGDSAHWALDEQRRLDGLVRQSIAWLLVQSCGITPEDGWIFEGFGLYLTRELVGTRLTWFVKPSEYLLPEEDQALKARLLDTRTNWMSEAQKLLEGERPPRLEFVLGKTVNNLSTGDLLYAYVLAAFLLEAKPEAIPGLLRAVGGGKPSQKALEEALGLTLAQVDERVRRWLAERF